MTIYHMGTEDIHFIPIGSPDVTTENVFRHAWARGSLSAAAAGDGGVINKRWRAPLPDMPVATSEFWLTCRMWTANAVPRRWFRFLSGDAQERITLWGTSGSNPILKRKDDDETVTTLATGAGIWASAGKNAKIDIYCNLSTGVFKVYSDYYLILNTVADLTNSEFTDITGFELSDGNFQEVLWRSDDTRKVIGLRSIWPVEAGNADEWSGTNADVDEFQVDMSDANFTDTSGLYQQYKVPPLPSLTGNTIVGAVMLGARIASNPVDVQLNVRTGGNDYNSSSFSTNGAVEDHMVIWETNPDTGLPWTVAEVNDAEFNIGVASA